MENPWTEHERLECLLQSEATLLSEFAHETEGKEEPERAKYLTSYLGSKQKLVAWIWKQTPEGIGSVFDAFCGSAAVAYMYKSKGLRVTASDRLRYCYHIARAIIENNKTRLSEADLEMLLADNSDAGTFVRENYSGIYFHPGIHARIDIIRTNIDNLKGYKKDLALFALARTCIQATDHGHFSSRKPDTRTMFKPADFDAKFRKFAETFNQLVFDNGKENKAILGEVESVLPTVQADLVYFDPPYATQFSNANYTTSYHFVEGLMSYWKGMELTDSALKNFKSDHKALTAKTAPAFFQAFLGAAQHIPIWLLSYRDKAFPNESQMRGIFKKLGRNTKMRSTDHSYNLFNAKQTDANAPKERLFLAMKSGVRAVAGWDEPEPETTTALDACAANIHTSAWVDLTALSTAAESEGDSEFPQFHFTLCHVGTNANGDHFTQAELSSRFATAINKKVDLKHSQDLQDIVGGIVQADYVEDGKGARIDCVGELYKTASPQGALAYTLMKRGIVSQVSMECDYIEGECSICQKRVKSKADYCLHLANFKGGAYQGQPVYEILHGVTFTGLGLLDRKGADENAKISKVAHALEAKRDSFPGAVPMAGANTEQPKANKEPGGGDSGSGDQDMAQDNKALQAKIKQLEQENQKLKQRIEELEAEQQVEARKKRAEHLLAKFEQKAGAISDEDARNKKLKEFSAMSEPEFAAYEKALADMPAPTKSESKQVEATNHRGDGLKTEARVYPYDVDDKPGEDFSDLGDVIMAAYQERIANYG